MGDDGVGEADTLDRIWEPTRREQERILQGLATAKLAVFRAGYWEGDITLVVAELDDLASRVAQARAYIAGTP